MSDGFEHRMGWSANRVAINDYQITGIDEGEWGWRMADDDVYAGWRKPKNHC